MASKPTVGGSTNTWGQELNDFLDVEHTTGGFHQSFTGPLALAGNLAINTNKFTVAGASGNTLVAGTLNVTGVTTLATISATSLATSAVTPLKLTNGQLVDVALTSQTSGATTLTIPDFAGVVDEFTFKTKSQTMSNKTFVAPALGAATGTSIDLGGTSLLASRVLTVDTGGSFDVVMGNTSGDDFIIQDGNFYLYDQAVDHGTTGIAPTNVYGSFKPNSATDGTLIINGLSDADSPGFIMQSVMGSTNPTDATPSMLFVANKTDGGTSFQIMGNAETAFQFRSFATNYITVLGDGKVGILDVTPSYNLEVNGTSHVTGEFTAGTKTFKIDSPVLPNDKDLLHACVEGPRIDLLYHGVVALVQGIAIVNLDRDSTTYSMTSGTFELLTQNAIVVGLHNQESFDRLSSSKIVDGEFIITSENLNSNGEVAWVVLAERCDPFIKDISTTDEDGRLIPEHDKEDPDLTLLEDKEVDTDNIEEDGDESVEEVNMKGKGYKRHYEAYGDSRPTRKVIKRYKSTS